MRTSCRTRGEITFARKQGKNRGNIRGGIYISLSLAVPEDFKKRAYIRDREEGFEKERERKGGKPG